MERNEYSKVIIRNNFFITKKEGRINWKMGKTAK